jgi:nitrite reductase/ring-hydroxylating ferredoxin subunit
MTENSWIDVGASEVLAQKPVQELRAGTRRIALTFKNGQFGAISGICNHVGGPLGNGRLDGDYVVCPWHYYKFHWQTGEGEPGYEDDRVPAHDVKVENGRVLVLETPRSKRNHLPHEPHPLARSCAITGPIRVLRISTTSTAPAIRYSTSEDLLEHGLGAARSHKDSECETQLLRIRELSFRACEGFYSKSARACTWPC